MGEHVLPLRPAPSDVVGDPGDFRVVLGRQMVAVDEDAAGAQQRGELLVRAGQFVRGQVVQCRRGDGRVQRAVQVQRLDPAGLTDDRLDIAGGGAVVGAGQFQQQGVHVDAHDLRVRQAQGQSCREGSGAAAEIEHERWGGILGRGVLDHVGDHREPFLAADRVPLLLAFPAFHPQLGRRHAQPHPVAPPSLFVPVFRNSPAPYR